MTAPSYQLDTISANLIERLEGSRRTWMDAPEAAAAGFGRIAGESLERVLAEHDEMLGTPGHAAVLRREVMETFLPRYTRLAIAHNELEVAGYKAWRGGDPIARVAATAAAVVLAVVLARVVHHPLVFALLPLVLMVPFIPEFRRWWYRRRYRALLQEVVDDMARIQKQIEALPVVGP